jgi:HPt (histidine-containing phosphotransfer) domain-containing protein
MKVDLSYLREMSGGSKELVTEMISIFKIQVVEFSNEMDQLLQDKQYVLLGRLAHKAKSSVSIMGMEGLASRLKDLEENTRDSKNIESYAAIVEEFKKETGDAVKELNVVINNIDLYI